MVKGEYKLIDTGYANTTASGTQETRAYSGSSLGINVEDLAWDDSSNTSSQPNPGRYTESEVNYASFNNTRIVLTCNIATDDANYVNKLKGYRDMARTKGLKLFYYTLPNDGYRAVTTVFGATDNVTNQSTLLGGSINALLVRVLSFRYNEKGTTFATKGLRRFTLTLEVTNPTN